MGNPLDTLNVAAGAEALPLELLQPLDSSNPSASGTASGSSDATNESSNDAADLAALELGDALL